jgi:CYTH domain-containing protein
MVLEIEKKWLWNPNVYMDELLCELPSVDIKDYYFNEYCRMRIVEGLWYLTIKSKGNLIREEYEFLIDKEQDIDFIPAPILCKRRFYYQKDGYLYEINLFKDIYMGQGLPLVIVELELESPNILPDTLPEFCGKDVTNENSLYGYQIFQLLKENYDKIMELPKKDNVVYLFDKK